MKRLNPMAQDSDVAAGAIAAPPSGAHPGRYDAFVSYAREDHAVVERLRAALEERGKTVWVDVRDIVVGADWRDRITRGIEACTAFVFVLSPDSLSSEPCRAELDQAAALNKLIVPVYCRDTAGLEPPSEVRDRQWVFLRSSDSFTQGLERLVEALETDLQWRDQHTRLAGRTREWLDSNRDSSFLLRGSDLGDAETWLAQQARHKQQATAEQTQFIVESRRGANVRQRALFAGVGVALAIAVVLAALALVQRERAVTQAKVATARQLAAVAVSQLSNNLDVAQLLAAQAYDMHASPQTRGALLQVVTHSPHLVRYLPMGGRVTQLSGSSDKSTVVAGLADGRVVRWTLSEPKPRQIAALQSSVTSLAVSSDGTKLIAADGTNVVLWPADGPTTEIELPEGHSADAVTISPSGRTAVVSASPPNFGERGVIVTVDGRNGTIDTVREDPFEYPVTAPALVASSDEELVLLDRGYGYWQRRTLPDWKLAIGSRAAFGVRNDAVGVSGSGNTFTYTNGASTIPVWRTTEPSDPDHSPLTAEAPIAPASDPTALTLSPDGAQVAIASSGVIYVSAVTHDGARREPAIELVGNGSINTDGLRFFGDSTHLISASGNSIALWDLDQVDRISRTVPVPIPVACGACGPPTVVTAPDGRRVAVVDGSGQSAVIRGIDDHTNVSEEEFTGGSFLYGPPVWDASGRRVTLLASPPGGGFNVSVPRDMPPSFEALAINEAAGPVIAASRGHDGRSIVLVDARGYVLTRDPDTGAVRVTTRAGSTAERTASLNPGAADINRQSTLVAVVDDGSVEITDLSSEQLVGTIRDVDAVYVEFSGDRLLVQRSNGRLEVWTQRGSTRERVISGDESYVWAPVADQQGTIVARRRSNGSTDLTDLDSGTVLTSLAPPGASFAHRAGMAFTPDGTRFITAVESGDGREGQLVRRDISADALLRTACETAGRDLSAAEWQTFAGLEEPGELACARDND